MSSTCDWDPEKGTRISAAWHAIRDHLTAHGQDTEDAIVGMVLAETDVTEKTARNLLRDLNHHGYLRRPSRGRYELRDASDVLTPPPAQVAASVPPAAPGATQSAPGSPSADLVLSEAERAMRSERALHAEMGRALTTAVALRQERDDAIAALSEARAEREAARTTAALLEADGARLRERIAELAEQWRYKGEFGWGPWQEGYGPDQEGIVLDHAAVDLRALLAPEPVEPLTDATEGGE